LVYEPVAGDFPRPFQVAIGLGKGMKKDTNHNPKTMAGSAIPAFYPGKP